MDCCSKKINEEAYIQVESTTVLIPFRKEGEQKSLTPYMDKIRTQLKDKK